MVGFCDRRRSLAPSHTPGLSAEANSSFIKAADHPPSGDHIPKDSDFCGPEDNNMRQFHTFRACACIVTALALAALILAPSAAFGAAAPGVKNITTGVTYTSLAAAVAAVQSNQILELLETATYESEKVNITVANVTLRAASGKTPTLDGGYKEYCLKAAANGIQVSGITFVNAGKYGVKVENASDVVMSNLVCNGWFANNGVYAASAPRLSLTNISFENCGDAGISINSSTSVTATGLTATHVSASSCKTAIEIVGCTGASFSSLTAGAWSDVIVVKDSQQITLSNITISSGDNGIDVDNSPGTTINTCTTSDLWGDVIVIHDSQQSALSNLTISGGDTGVTVDNSPGTTVSTCTTSGLWGKDIYVRDTTGFTFSGGTVHAAMLGIELNNVPNASILNSTVTNSTSPAIGIKAVSSPNLLVQRVTIDGYFYGSGVYTKNSTGITIRNTIVKNTVIGINLDDNSDNVSIINNTIAFNQSSGIFVASGCENVTIRNNIVVSNGWNYWTWGIQCQSTTHPGLSITYNDVWNNRLDYQNCSAGTGDISADPLFTSPPANLHETQESPCVDAGDPADPVGSEPSPNGGRINQGAYGGTSEAATSPQQVTVSLATAASNGWIGLYCQTWDGIEYVPVSAMDTTPLSAWTGFWVQVSRNLDILFPPSSGQPSPPATMTMTVDPLQYYLVSAPLLPSNGDQSAVFGDDIGGSPEVEWRVSKYNYLTNSFQRYTGTGSIPGVIPGRGFWMYVNLDTQKTLGVTGSPVSQSGDYALKLLSNGSSWTYHMIGNPFPYNFRWGDVKVRVPVTQGLPLGKPAVAALDETVTWYIGLELADTNGGYKDTNNRAGVIESGPDYHTVLSAPDLGSAAADYVRLALRDPDASERKLLAYDYRRPGQNEYRWEIELTSTVDAIPVSFRLANLATVPRSYRITLIDKETGTEKVIDADTAIPVTLSVGKTRLYTLIATDLLPTGVESASPLAFGITGVSPNPFNPATDISFSIDRPGNVRIAVYSLSGQLVATPAEGFMPAGRRTIRWNAAGCASGVYIVSLESQGKRDNRKITFLK